MKKLHDVLFDEYKRMYVDEEPHTLLTGDEEADKSAFFEKGKLSAFFTFNASLCWDVYSKLLEFTKGISEKSEKKVVIFATCSLSEYMRGALAADLHEPFEEELSEEQRERLVEAMKGYKGRDLYIENSCFSTEEIIHFLDSRDDIEAAYIAKYEDFCTAPPENNMARAKEDFCNFNRLANCAERNNISIFLQTDYDDLYTYGTSVYANFEVRGELAQNRLINVVTCDFVEDEYQKLKFTRIENIPRYPEYVFRVGDEFKY
ncbi:MAG: hypothetical protein IJI67_06175 [Clostridia bacterium]|nr:hypothetical protein [Clostridia bacterium]